MKRAANRLMKPTHVASSPPVERGAARGSWA